MIHSLKPDSRGRLSLKEQLGLMGWVPGQGIKLDLIELIELPKKEKQE